MRRLLLGLALLPGLAGAAAADSLSFSLPMIGSWTGYSTTDTSLSFSGDGYVGMLGAAYSTVDYFTAAFALDFAGESRVAAQVNIAGLAGATVTSATLSFVIRDSLTFGQTYQVVGAAGTGTLGYAWDAPATSLGTANGSANFGPNSLSVTGMVQAAVAGGSSWLNLHLMGTGSAGAYTYAGYDQPVDRAALRLEVEFTPAAAVPEPLSLGLFGLGLAGLGVMRRRSRGAAATP